MVNSVFLLVKAIFVSSKKNSLIYLEFKKKPWQILPLKRFFKTNWKVRVLTLCVVLVLMRAVLLVLVEIEFQQKDSGSIKCLIPIVLIKTFIHTKKQTDMKTHPIEGFAVDLVDDNIYKWRVYIAGPGDTCYHGGIFQAELDFPMDYPFSPPTMKFISEFWHPNVYPDGKVCIRYVLKKN